MAPSTALSHALPFAQQEYDRRLADVRLRMQQRDIEVLLVFTPENVNYLTGYETIGYNSYLCLMVPLDSEPVLLVREMELPVARMTTWLSHFHASGDTEDPVASTRTALAERGWLRRPLGMEETAPFFTVQTWRRLVTALGAGRITDGSGLVELGRRIKSAAELAYIRAACRLAEAGMSAAMEAIRPGVTENEVSAAAYEGMVGGGSDFLTTSPIVTSGPRSGVAHTTFRNREIAAGDTVLVEMGACQRRYFGALMRTFVPGSATSEIERLAAVVREALDASIAVIRPGVSSGEVDEACRGVIERAGYEQHFRKRTGYSMGVAFAPNWGEGHIVSLQRDDPTLLEPGMLFHIPPALRVYQRCCVGMSETVAVSETGCEVLTNFPRKLLIR